MYECQMKMVIPPGVGLLVAGLASGICFLLIGSLRKGKGEKSADDNRCACCLKPFLVGRGVECSDCGGRSCRKACCRWDSVDNAWFCLFCYHTRSWSRKKDKWFRNFGGLPVESEVCKNFSTAKSRVYDEGAEDVAVHSELDLAAGGCKERDSMETVREFVEKIVEGLVGNVDDTPIDRLYDHPAYKPATDTPTMAHTALRELVERAVDEARKLPSLGATVSTGLQDDLSLSEQNYEDLLATAILNKVIEKFQNGRVDDNSNVLHRKLKSKLANHDNETGLDEDEEGGSSSLEPVSQDDRSSDESGPRTRHIHVRQEPLSLTIEEQIEEVTTTYTSDEELRCPKTTVLDFRNARRVPFPEFGMDIVDPSQDSSEDSPEDGIDLTHVDRVTPVESWEENWLFQKRKIQTQSEPVAMLVPNPSSDFRALIGDRDAEDTSDLSEFSAQSDDEAEDDELTEAINRVVPKAGRVDTDFSPGFEEARKTSGSPESQDPKAEASTSQEDRPEVDVYSEPEINNWKNDNDKYRGKTSQYNEELKEKDSGLLRNTSDDAKPLKTNGEIPKTPTTSLMRNSETGNTAESSVGCDEFAFIGARIQDKETTKEPSRTETPKFSSARSKDKIEKEDYRAEKDVFPSGIEVDRHSQSSTTIGCPKVNSRDVNDDDVRREVEGSGRCNGLVQEVLKNSSNGDAKSNGDANGIQDGGVIANGIFVGDTNRRCEALAQAKAVSASEKPSLRIEVNENIGLATPPRPGTIAEREHKKWENAAPIENNPYSEENIQKRLLERQYARRSSDVSGSSKLQTCPSPPLQIVLGAGRPDFKRFGRDYYINEARNPKGQSVEESGFFTATSRPNSSLSQHSLSIGSDYEQQVSHGLDRFEEASLRGSLRRRSYRGPNASPHFVTNPLVHLDLDQNYNAERHVNPSSQWETLEAINPVMHTDLPTRNDPNSKPPESSPQTRRKHFQLQNGIDVLVDAKNPFVKDADEDSTINPLFNCEDEILRLFGVPFPADHDSGMYSIESADFEYCSSEKTRNIKDDVRDFARLNWSPREDERNFDRACTSDGRKYWTLMPRKFNTFGGIKRRKSRLDPDHDFDADDVTVAKGAEDYQDVEDDPDDDFFAGLKFQTFGGIKRDDGTKEMSKFRKQKVRPTVRNLEVFEDKLLSGIFKKSKPRLINTKASTLPPVLATRKSIKTNVLSDDDAQSLKLEPPEVPKVVHRSFKSLQDLRQGSGSRSRRKVRSKCSKQ